MDEWDATRRRDQQPGEGQSFLNRLQGGLDQLLGGTREERELAGALRPLVRLPCRDALDELALYLTQEGARVTGRSKNSVSLAYHKGRDGFILLILLFFLLLPGILY
jgi:hypothetical protein